jgi:acetyl-CoA decarbonylase/synthase complex subunit alpha
MVTRINIRELESGDLKIKGLELTVGKFTEFDEWAEPMGPTPYPSLMDLREWDLRLLERYPPLLLPLK